MTGPSAGVKVERPRGMGVVSFFVMFALAAYFAYTEKNPFREQQAEQPEGRSGRHAARQPAGPRPRARPDVPVGRGPRGRRDRRPGRLRAPPASAAARAPRWRRSRGAERDARGLEFDPDPRRAVIQAYVRMETVLAAHGHAREPHEAPLEYLARVLRELDVRAEAAHALTELFERARFSRHEIDAAMRAEAVASLEAVRDDLRQAA